MIERVCVVGNTASGKSFFAGQIGRGLGLPVIHLDKIYWQPGWDHISVEEFLDEQHSLIAQEKWVIDGCFSEFGLTQRFGAAGAVVFLDMPFWTCLRRAMGRRGDEREDLLAGADDRKIPALLGLAFLAEIVLFGLLDRPRILAAARRTGVPLIRVRNWADEPAALAALRTF